MHDKTNEVFDRIAKLTFGPSATVAGSMGSAVAVGDVRIILDGKTIGTGHSFAGALQRAQKSAGRELTHHADTLVATG